MFVYVGLAAFVLFADRLAARVTRRRFERQRAAADFPLTNTPNWRTPSF